jgi:hypothetical protein
MVSFSTVFSHFPLFPSFTFYFSLSKVFSEKFHHTQSKAFPQQTALCKYRNYVVLFSFHSKLNKFLFLQKLPAERGLLWSSVWSSHRVSAFFLFLPTAFEPRGIWYFRKKSWEEFGLFTASTSRLSWQRWKQNQQVFVNLG